MARKPPKSARDPSAQFDLALYLIEAPTRGGSNPMFARGYFTGKGYGVLDAIEMARRALDQQPKRWRCLGCGRTHAARVKKCGYCGTAKGVDPK